jgi:alanyl-tRNA synthetase
LNAKPGFFAFLVPVVIEILVNLHYLIFIINHFLYRATPFLNYDPTAVIEIINEEETQFLKTLRRGHVLFEKAVKALPPNLTQKHCQVKLLGVFMTHMDSQWI